MRGVLKVLGSPWVPRTFGALLFFEVVVLDLVSCFFVEGCSPCGVC